MFTTHPLHKGCGQGEIGVLDLLCAKVDAVMHQPAVGAQPIPLLTCVPQVESLGGELAHPHQAYGATHPVDRKDSHITTSMHVFKVPSSFWYYITTYNHVLGM